MSGLYQITYSQARADKPSGILRQRRMYFCILPGAVLSVYKLPQTPGGVLEAAFSATEDSSLEAWSALCKARSYPVPETAAVSASFTVARGWWPAGTS
nr:uncharacterized protein LOC110122044 isoform X2 [Odocoileus virginianus texanus]